MSVTDVSNNIGVPGTCLEAINRGFTARPHRRAERRGVTHFVVRTPADWLAAAIDTLTWFGEEFIAPERRGEAQ